VGKGWENARPDFWRIFCFAGEGFGNVKVSAFRRVRAFIFPERREGQKM